MRVRIQNFAMHPVRVTWSLHFEADFADIFEVRGTKRPQSGRLQKPESSGDSVLLAYEGLDGTVRRTRLEFSPAPHAVARFDDTLPPKGEQTYFITIACESGDGLRSPAHRTYEDSLGNAVEELVRARACDAEIK